MALKIRLARGGAKKRPFYRIVIADSRSPRDGRFIERVGEFNPLLPKDNENRIKLKEERIKYWLGNGAKPTTRVARFLGEADILEFKHGNNPNKGKPGKKRVEREEAERLAAEEAANAPAAEAPAEEAPAEETPAEEAPAEEEAAKEG
jgi:small subunit ribosomal protein S16